MNKNNRASFKELSKFALELVNNDTESDLHRVLMNLLQQIDIPSCSPAHHQETLLVASHLHKTGYGDFKADFDITRFGQPLSPDLLAYKADSSVLVEVETLDVYLNGKNGLSQNDRLRARLVGKTARYSRLTDKFFIAVPHDKFDEDFYNSNGIGVPIMKYLTTDPKQRMRTDTNQIKRFVDKVYRNPPIDRDVVRNAKLDGIMLVNVPEKSVEIRQY